MRELTLRVTGELLNSCNPPIGVIEHCEVLTFFKLTPETHLELCNIALASGASIDDLKGGYVDDVIVIKQTGESYICLIKGTFSAELAQFIDQFDLKLAYPVIYGGDYCQFSVVGTAEELQAIVAALRKSFGDLDILAARQYDPHLSSVLNGLTEKQRDVLLQAYRLGYFDYPRKIDAAELARKLGIKKTTLLEHLHKAEKRLIGRILEETN